ncbi:MAG: hypothetical protein ACKO7G_08085 [Gammaproteobacteria bacterium]
MTASPPLPQQIPARVTSIIAGHALPADLPGHDIPVVNPTSEEVISRGPFTQQRWMAVLSMPVSGS